MNCFIANFQWNMSVEEFIQGFSTAVYAEVLSWQLQSCSSHRDTVSKLC